MAVQLIHDRVVMECLEGVWETLKGNERCRFRATIRLTATSLVHPEQPARTLQQPVEWILPTPTPYRLVEPVQVVEVSSSEEDLEQDPEEIPPKPAWMPLTYQRMMRTHSLMLILQRTLCQHLRQTLQRRVADVPSFSSIF